MLCKLLIILSLYIITQHECQAKCEFLMLNILKWRHLVADEWNFFAEINNLTFSFFSFQEIFLKMKNTNILVMVGCQ